ncbi:hypothetical protein GCM10010124_28630 [Pilimelia terevasa]|uniref:Regulator of SigK n=1 Tax=Pilimelia terevasa TaxID=53372 RepID=A0A8J3FJP3_9ACTN|nr:anti-sigma factor [Pilimelia terevasa]GGK34294.1 hypothetical protein GCM10010124_28630 [Pilimelia terevasa]
MTDIHTLAGAYALDALDELERAAFDRHLRECAACATEVAELREAAARLADPTWSVPPPALRDRVLADIGRTRQVGPELPRPARRGAAPRWRRFAAAAAVVGLATAGGAAGAFAWQQRELRQERAVLAATRAEAARMQAVMTAPDARVHGGDLAGGGRITVVVSARENLGVVVLAAPPAEAGKVYQYWMLDGARPVSAAVLASGEHHSTRVLAGVQGMESFGVTVEPAGGSPTPSLPVRAGIPLV